MWSSRFIFGLFAIYSIYFFTETSQTAIFKLTNAVCETYNESWVVINQCRLKAVKRDITVMNANVTLVHPAKNINLFYQVFKRESGYKPWLWRGNIDVCRFLKKTYNPFANMMFNMFKQFTNFNSTCPLLGDHFLKDFYLKPDLMPLPLPTGDYMLSLRWSFDNKLQFDTNVSSSFVEDPFAKIK